MIGSRVRRSRLSEQPFDGLPGLRFLGQRSFGEGAVTAEVAVEGLEEEGLLVAERGVQAGGGDAERFGEHRDRCRVVPVLPEDVDGGLECLLAVEGSRSSRSHPPIV